MHRGDRGRASISCHANIFTHGQSKTYSPDPEMELELDLKVDPELEVEVLEATAVKDESESMSFTCKNGSTVFENGASFGSVCASLLYLGVYSAARA